MEQIEPQLDLLKQILDNLRTPGRLDTHPWAHSLTVQATAAENSSWASESPGTQLVLTIAALFRQLMPASPPQRNGKRIDTRWGRFGILAANYFAPLLYGRFYPRALREAARRIDQAILLFVYGLPAEKLAPEQIKSYELLGDGALLAANSTISDWHHGGLQDLADAFLSREKSLALVPGEPVLPHHVVGADQGPEPPAPKLGHPRRARLVKYVGLACIGLAAVLAGTKLYHIFRAIRAVQADMQALQAMDLTSLQSETLQDASPALSKMHADLLILQAEASPFFPLSRRLGWIPTYGGDLKYADEILSTAVHATQAASTTLQAVMPIWEAVQQQPDLRAPQVTQMLIDTAPALRDAQTQLEDATTSRRRIKDAQLSSDVRALILRADTPLSALGDALSLSLAVPGLLGATEAGPKTYLVLVQNEDELRATGGLISAVGKVVVRNGELMDFQIEDSYAVDDMEKPYPPAPWQMQSFMNIPVMVFRDTSWFVNYPTAAQAAEYLYAYTHSFSVDGVFAIDQHVLETILSVTGPVYVSGIDTTVTAQNIREVMRMQKVPPLAEQGDPDWQRKHFINPMAAAILQRLISGHSVPWEQLVRSLLGELDQRHILVQLDDPAMTAVLSARGWDGAVRAPAGDFLMVVDTNVGYNKTNAVVSSRLSYDVDLTDTSRPRTSLSVIEKNDATSVPGPCVEIPTEVDWTTVQAWYRIQGCYYDYLRIYVPAGTQLTASTPHPVSRAEMVMLDADVPPRVDLLDDHIANVTGFGTLLVVRRQGSLVTSFEFAPPAAILQVGAPSGALIYQLKIEKQAGSVAVPVTVRVRLPQGSQITSANKDFSQDGDYAVFDLDLRTDINLQVEFRP